MVYSSYIDRLERKLKKNYKDDPFDACSGSEIQPTREYRIVNGIKTLVITGETNIQDFIDSYAESTDINVIINKFLNGDMSVLNPTEGAYGDFRNCPNTYAEMFDRVQVCKNLFNTLPVEIKEKFDNAPEKFWTEYGSSYFDSVFNEYNQKFTENMSENTVSESEVKNAE